MIKSKNISHFSLVSFIFIACAATLWAQPSDQTQQNLKTITLKDGTKIKGTLTGIQNGIYSIETNSLGKITVKDSDVESISTSEGSAPSSIPPSMKGQVEALQGQVMADPEFMASVQELTRDPKFIELLQDPDFMNVILSRDPQKIQNNPKIQLLLQDPKMQKLMQRMNEKHLGQ